MILASIVTYPIFVCIVLYFTYEQMRCLVKGIPYDRSKVMSKEAQIAFEAMNRKFESTINDECPICMTEMGELKTTALCSHSFCAKCIVEYIKSKNRTMVQCPFCRNDICYITSKSLIDIDIECAEMIQAYNARFSQERSFGDLILDFPLIVRQQKEDIRNSLIKLALILVAMTVIYYSSDYLLTGLEVILDLCDDFIWIAFFFIVMLAQIFAQRRPI